MLILQQMVTEICPIPKIFVWILSDCNATKVREHIYTHISNQEQSIDIVRQSWHAVKPVLQQTGNSLYFSEWWLVKATNNNCSVKHSVRFNRYSNLDKRVCLIRTVVSISLSWSLAMATTNDGGGQM